MVKFTKHDMEVLNAIHMHRYGVPFQKYSDEAGNTVSIANPKLALELKNLKGNMDRAGYAPHGWRTVTPETNAAEELVRAGEKRINEMLEDTDEVQDGEYGERSFDSLRGEMPGGGEFIQETVHNPGKGGVETGGQYTVTHPAGAWEIEGPMEAARNRIGQQVRRATGQRSESGRHDEGSYGGLSTHRSTDYRRRD